MKIVAKNSLTLSNINDGTITHYAYAYSADGKDGFYVGGGTNLLINSNFSSGLNHWNVNQGSNKDCKAIVTTDSDGDTCIHITGTGVACGIYSAPVPFNQNQITTGSVLAKGTGRIFLVGLEGRPTSNFGTVSTESYSKVGSTTQASSNTNAFCVYFSAVNNVVDVYIKFVKLEQGDKDTSWSPEPSEAHPSYIGQYSDFSSTASTDPAKYAPWIIFKGNDGKTGDRGKSVWSYPYDRGSNRVGSYWSDLKPTPTTDNPPKVGDTIIDLVGKIYQITNVVVGTTQQGGGSFDYGPMLTSVKGADGNNSYTHTAYSWSADGTDRFTTTYPNLNLLTGTSDKPSTKTGGSWNNTVIGVYKTPKVGQKYTVSVEVPNADHTVIFEVWRWNNARGRVDALTTKRINSGEKGYLTFTWPDPDNSGATQIAVDLVWTNGTDTGTYSYCKAKLEEGSTATPWMPSESEVKTSDYPNYIGTYSDNNVKSSLDYSKYQWAIFKGQDSNAYTAYSWSSDGTDRFSTTYPNLNLLDGTSQPFIMGYGIPNTTWDATNQVSRISLPLTSIYDEVLPQGAGFPYMYNSGVTYTQSIYISTDAPLTGTPIKFTWFTGKYGHNTSGVDNLVKVSGNVYRATSTYTWPSSNSSDTNGRNADFMNLTKVFDFTKGTFLQFYKPKLELGSVATPWIPSASEAQEQWQDAIPMYIGVGEKDSQNPSDYRWQLNPRYVQASSDSGLSNKAGVDDLASVANTANNALVQAQNAVSNEDYTSWLEHGYQSTIKNLQDVSAQNQKDIKNVDDRTTIVEGFYGEMKVKWNFIDESFSFSEEGMFISNAQSKMSIQITSDKIVFWDNNIDVAFITGEVLNIQKGVFLESATIGNHLITKFSNDSPVTIIRYVGGIT